MRRDKNPMKGHLRGHAIRYSLQKRVWRYSDTGLETTVSPTRACIKCGKHPDDFSGHDPCIASLSGVKNACCGHGVDEGYVQFEDGRVIRGVFDEKGVADVRDLEEIDGYG